ncbi:MAG TPA: threonyl-tRNA synthetase editing domain-containing protein [Natronoarchaeum rubrum]|nr:threonyl-tRNA synthetase editing domain-containing protein [Natronoarchaeum rubrum]
MRLLAVHADSLSFEAVQPASEGDAAPAETSGPDGDAPKSGSIGECVVGVVAIERGDRAELDAVAADAAAELDAVADRLGAERIGLIPREELVDDPADAAVAATALEAIADRLDAERELLRAPVGWRLASQIERKGHPFAEQAIRVVPRRQSGDETPRGSGETPNRRAKTPSPSAETTIEALSALGLATPDPAADGDAVRWLPRGQFLRDALREYAEDALAGTGAAPASTPSIDVHAAADRRAAAEATGPIVGPADHHQLLRPGDHGGLLSFFADAALGGAPVRVAETARWSTESAANRPPATFDRRVRPEYHAALPDDAAAVDEFERLAGVAAEASAALGADAATLTLAEGFATDRPAFGDRIAAALDDPVAVETVPDEGRYWAARLSFVVTDGDGRERTLGSVELDAATPKRFDIGGDDESDDDESDDDETPTLVHAAPIGDVEKAIAALAARAAASDRSGLPIWLAPTQVRLVPIDDRHVERCDDAAAELRAAGVRADVDAREVTVGERLDRADRERVPYVAVVGDRELDGAALAVRRLEPGREDELSVDELGERVLADCGERSAPVGRLPTRIERVPADSDV